MSEKAEKPKKSRKRWKIIIILLVCVFLTADIIAANFLVSACLVPDFMRKLDDFERITKESYDRMVNTTDVTENHKMLVFLAEQWQEQNKAEKISAVTDDGYTLIASRFMQPEHSDKWALVLHGYTGWKEEMYPFAAWYYQQGYNVIVPDLRCQGESEGDFIGMGYTDSFDCRLWLDQILSEDPNAQIVLHGQSMGAATALMMSGMEDLPSNVKAVIADSSYTTGYAMFGEKMQEWFHLPPFPLEDTACLMLLLRGGYDLRKASPVNAVTHSKTPTLFIHGTEDEMIPVRMTYELYEAASCKKELMLIEGAGHAQAQDAAPAGYFTAIGDFCREFVED